MELREKIVAELKRGWVAIPSEPGRIADRILAIPEIAEALIISAGHPEGDFRDYMLKRGRWAEVGPGIGYA